MIKNKIIITGRPGYGKSSLILRFIQYYQEKGRIIHGFLTPEVRNKSKRIGFDILDIATGKKDILARTRIINSKFKLGRYDVDLNFLEEIISRLDSKEDSQDSLIIIDEIGKMELFSDIFQQWLIKIFNSERKIISTIGLNLKHSLKTFILHRTDSILFHLNRENQEEIFSRVLTLL